MRLVIIASLFVCGTAMGSSVVDLQGSVDGGWPSALNGQDIAITVNVDDHTASEHESKYIEFDPGNWPTPNQMHSYVGGTIGNTVTASVFKADFGVEELTGTDGKRYAVYLAADATDSHTVVVGDVGPVPLDLDVTVKVQQEQPSNTDPTPDDGDTNSDGDVDWFDMETLWDNYGTTSGATWEDGDSDGDGDVDFTDYLAANANYVAWP